MEHKEVTVTDMDRVTQHTEPTELSISSSAHQICGNRVFQEEEFEMVDKDQHVNGEGENESSPFFEVSLGQHESVFEKNKYDFHDELDPELIENVLPVFDEIIDKGRLNNNDNMFGTVDPTDTFCDLSDVLDVDQSSESCSKPVRDNMDKMLPYFDKINTDSEMIHPSHDTEFDSDSIIEEPLYRDENVKVLEEECNLLKTSNGTEYDKMITTYVTDCDSVHNDCDLDLNLIKDDTKSESTVHTNKTKHKDLKWENEMTESPVSDHPVHQSCDFEETESECQSMSVINVDEPSNEKVHVNESDCMYLESKYANNDVLHLEKEGKTGGWTYEKEGAESATTSDVTDVEAELVNFNQDVEELDGDMLVKESGTEVCSPRTDNLDNEGLANATCMNDSFNQRNTQDISETDNVEEEDAEYLTEKESCFVVLGTLLVIMCIELYSSSNKSVCATETDLLESSDDLGLNLLFRDETEVTSRNPRHITSARSKAARKRKKQQQKLLAPVNTKKKTKMKFAENLEDLRPPWYSYETSLTDVDHSLTCSVCLEMYYLPSVCQPCTHIFCDPCLRRLTRGMGTEGILCPLCRTVIASCSLDKEFHEQLKVSHPDIYYARHSTEKKSKYRHYLLPFTPPVPLSKRLLRHLVTNRTNNLPPLNQGTLYNCSKLLVGCLAGACISVLIMLFCHVRGIQSARDVNIMFLSFFTGAIVTIVVNKIMRF